MGYGKYGVSLGKYKSKSVKGIRQSKGAVGNSLSMKKMIKTNSDNKIAKEMQDHPQLSQSQAKTIVKQHDKSAHLTVNEDIKVDKITSNYSKKQVIDEIHEFKIEKEVMGKLS